MSHHFLQYFTPLFHPVTLILALEIAQKLQIRYHNPSDSLSEETSFMDVFFIVNKIRSDAKVKALYFL